MKILDNISAVPPETKRPPLVFILFLFIYNTKKSQTFEM